MKPVEGFCPSTVPPVSQLVALAQSGDRAAFELLLREHHSAVKRQLLRLTQGDSHKADDLAQDVWVLVWQQLPTFRGDAAFATWLFRVAYTRFLMYRRAREGHDTAAAPVSHEDPPDPTDPALRLDIHRALGNLPEPERLVVIHCLQLGLSHADAAAVLGMPIGTVKTRLERGKTRLRTWLTDWETPA